MTSFCGSSNTLAASASQPEKFTNTHIEYKTTWRVRISVNPIGRFGFIRSLFHLLFRPCQFYLK